MTPDDIWSSLFDKGINDGLESFSEQQIHLYHYIDFFHYVINGGPTGFLYNRSPAEQVDYDSYPYVKSWRFFNLNEWADLVEEYNVKYLSACNELKINKLKDDEYFSDKFNLTGLEERISEKMNEDWDKNNQIIYDWISVNKEILTKNLEMPQWLIDLNVKYPPATPS
jgi:hypothetical protein